MKNKIILIVAFMLIFQCVFAMAAPGEIYPNNVISNTSGILTVTNPSNVSISSYSKNHNISGYAANGVELSVYYYNNNSGSYCLLYKDGAPVVFYVGASGMFVKPVTLLHGKNSLLIRAETGGKVQYVKRTVTVLSNNFFNLFKGFNLF